jgi:sacsin
MQKQEECERPVWQEFRQKEELTTRLRNILSDYPLGPVALQEFVQNADDAGAHEFAVVLDLCSYPRESLISDQQGDFCGPSLMIWNSATFAEQDFASISRVGQSGKASDAGSIGKYGLGFNVAYHFTDCLSFVSREQLVIFDPHGKSLPDGLLGLQAPVDKLVGTNLAGQLAPFDAVLEQVFKGSTTQPASDQDSGCARSSPYSQGTIFRLPLRTPAQATTSLISGTAHSPAATATLLHEFVASARQLLFFLRSLKSIRVFISARQQGCLRSQCSLV